MFEKYERPEMEVVVLKTEDVITASGDENETDIAGFSLEGWGQ